MSMSRRRLFLIIGISLVILFSVMYILKKPILYKLACNNYASKDYVEAARQFKGLIDYKNSNEMYETCMMMDLDKRINDIVADEELSDYKPVTYISLLNECEGLLENKYFEQLSVDTQANFRNFITYVKFLSYLFNYDKDHEVLEINCETNPYFGENLTAFYNNYYKVFEKQSWHTVDRYSYYDEQVSCNIKVDTRTILKLEDETKKFSDSNVRGYVRFLVSYEGMYDNFSESVVVPVSELSEIKIRSKSASFNDYYDTEKYKEEMGGSDVAFLLNFKGTPPTVKYAPDYIESQAIHTLSLEKKTQ